LNKQFHDRLLADGALDQIFLEARTYNGWLDKPVSDEQLHAIWNLARMGPTSANMLPARIVWAKSTEAKQRLADLSGGTNPAKILAAPVTAIIGYDIDFHEQLPWLFPHTDARSWFEGDEKGRELAAIRNSSLQGGYFIIAARAVGLDTGPMSGFDNAGVDAAFFADQPRVRSNFICSVGYGDPATIFERSPRPDFSTFNRIV
jgi:3-hydroxypropanoate dehydrogenase